MEVFVSVGKMNDLTRKTVKAAEWEGACTILNKRSKEFRWRRLETRDIPPASCCHVSAKNSALFVDSMHVLLHVGTVSHAGDIAVFLTKPCEEVHTSHG